MSFRLAPMSPLILRLTYIMLALPPVLFGVALVTSNCALLIPASLILLIYAWVWLRFRPTHFIVHQELIEVIWPAKRREISRKDIVNVKLIDRQELLREIGRGMRIGAGGLWGGFGWLWTKQWGLVQMYVSRDDRFVWIERVAGRPWLITPEQPEAFVRALASKFPGKDAQ